MTDADWMRLLDEKSPREFTPEEIAALRVRIAESPVVRQALTDALQLEQTLAAGLANVDWSAEELWERALQREHAQVGASRPAWWKWVGLSAVILLAIAAGWWFQPGSPVAKPVAVTDAETPEADSRELDSETPPESPNIAAASPTKAVVTEPPTAERGAESPAVAMHEPWADWLLPEARPLSPDSPRLLSDLRTMGHDELSLAEFRRWWEDVPQQRAGVSQDRIGNRPTLHLQGWTRLRAPWLADTQLRLTPFDLRDLTLFFWTGDVGVALRYYREREPHLWAAYQVHRKPGESNPERWGLLTTDSGSFYHGGAATLEVSIASNRLVLSTGQTPVLVVPLEGLPTEVLMSTDSRLRGFSWLRAEPPALPRTDHTASILGEEPPSAWPWRTDQAAEAMLQREPDGGVTLTGSSRKEVARVFVPLDRPGLFESLIQVAAADPGTGVYLGDQDGKPLGQLAFFRDRRTSQTTYGFLHPNDRRTESDVDDRSQPPPYFVPQSWLRVVAGLGVWNTWCSGDGAHWGHAPENPVRDVVGAVRSVGLFCLPGDTPRTIRLQQLDVRPLTAVTSLAQPEWLTDLERNVQAWPRSFEDWLQLAWDTKPGDVSPQLWCDTCAVAALEQGPPRALANALLERLAESSRTRGAAAEERFRLLDECLLLTEHWSEPDAARWLRRYAAVASEREDVTGAAAWTALVAAPRWTHRVDRSPFQRGLSSDLLAGAYAGRWEEVSRDARAAAFWTAPAHPDHQPRDAAESLDRMAHWARGQASELSGSRGDAAEDALPVSWRHPAQLALDKEAYNVQAELQAALSTGAYSDAGRLMTSLSSRRSLGLLPDVREPGLLVSLPVALESSLRDHSELAEVMRHEFAELGRLRVARAQTEGDAAAVADAALQFLGTPAGSEAERWLGDQQLAVGEFLAALLHYRRALRWASEEQRPNLLARAVLAERMTGPLPGETVGALAGEAAALSLEGLALEALANDAAAAPASAAPTWPGRLQPTNLPIQPTRWEVLGRFDGQTGQNAGRGEFRDSDPFGRQFGVAVDDQRIYLNNRFQVTAYDRGKGDRLWASAVGGEQGEAHAHRFTAMPPIVVGNHVYVRRVMKTGIELAALEASSGETRWSYQPGAAASVISDPVWAADRLFALVAHELEQDQWELRWTRFDVVSGRILRETPLLRLRNAWDRELPCQLAVHGAQVVAVTGGVACSFDLAGTVDWVRRELWLPPRIDPLQHDHFVLPPVIAGQAVYVAQPNVRAVCALDRRTGRTRWSRPLPDLQGLLGVRLPVVLAAERETLIALEAATGDVQWRAALPGWQGTLAVNDDTIAVVRRVTRQGNRGWLYLTWLDTSSGRVLADSPLSPEDKDEWRFGPWFTVGGTVWGLAAEGARTPHRDLVRLRAAPDGPHTAGPFPDEGLGPWDSPVSAEHRHLAQLVLPGWQPLTLGNETLAYSADEIRGERQVLRTRVPKGRTLTFARTVSLREDDMPMLQLRVGRDGDSAWTLQVRAENQVLLEQVIDAQTAPDVWCDVHVPLGAFIGQTVLLQVQQTTSGDQPGLGLWKSLEIISE
uniref:Pyrrolo-quinoline quinone repeat domain-containing protein n=1 Tax=Schlesneria paludicola TaxID=360056 RepID=A0A7C2JZH0_9PLAN